MPVGYVDQPKFRIQRNREPNPLPAERWMCVYTTAVGSRSVIWRGTFEAAVRAMDDVIRLHQWDRSAP